MITLHIDLDFSTVEFEISGYKGEFDDVGTIEFSVPCSCGYDARLMLRVDDLQTLCQRAEKFQYDRVSKGCSYANAALIAAAPELLAALLHLDRKFGHKFNCEDADIVEAAIATAKGEA